MSQNQADPFGTRENQDAYFESLLKKQKENPEEFDKTTSPATRISLGYYVEAKLKKEKNSEK